MHSFHRSSLVLLQHLDQPLGDPELGHRGLQLLLHLRAALESLCFARGAQAVCYSDPCPRLLRCARMMFQMSVLAASDVVIPNPFVSAVM